MAVDTVKVKTLKHKDDKILGMESGWSGRVDKYRFHVGEQEVASLLTEGELSQRPY